MQSKERKQFEYRLRRNIWRSLLIMRSATVQELLSVVAGLTLKKARRLLRELETHGYLHKAGKARPVYSHAVCSPSLPAVCIHCEQPFHTAVCAPADKKKETKRDTERNGHKETACPAASAEEIDQLIAEMDKEAETERQRQRDRKTARPDGLPAATDYPDQGWHVLPEELKARLAGGDR